MIADRLRALVAELRTPRLIDDGVAFMSERDTDIADRLEQILAEDAGGWRPDLAGIIAPMLADGRTAGSSGVPRIGRQTRKKAEQIASAVLTALTSPPPQEPQP